MPTLVVILGPTGVGKTELSLQLAEEYGCPIVSADSRQIYHDLPIGTAAPTAEEQVRAKHYFIGCKALTETYNAGQYAREVLNNTGIWDDVQSKLSLGTDVTSVLNQVAQGSADCGIVYATDAKSTDDVKVICEAPDDALKTPVIYPVAMIKDAKDADAAQAFLDFLQTKEAKDVFVEYGFTIHE